MSDEPYHINFTGVESGRPAFHLLPTGINVIVEITDYQEEEAGDEAKNPGAKMINWEFTIESDEDGNEVLSNVRVRDPESNKSTVVDELKLEGRRLYDRMVMVEAMYPRIKEFIDACGFSTEGAIDLYPDQMVGERLMIQIGIQPGKKDRRTGDRYRARNRVTRFLPLPSDEPAPVAAEAPVDVEKEIKAKAKTKGTEEAKV